MTDESSDTMAEEPTANSNVAVLAAIADLGMNATPAAIAKKVGIAYSTVNPKLRAWENAGLAERFRHHTGQTLWRLTDPGRASTATPPEFAAADPAAAETTAAQATSAAQVPPGAGPSGATATEPSDDDGDGREPVTPTVPPVPADSDTALPEPITTGTPMGHDVNLSGDEEPVGSAAAAVGGTTRAIESVTEPDEDHRADAGTSPAAAPGKRRRPKGALQASVLAVLRADPDREYTTDDVKKEIDQADADTGYPRASHGAVSNALDKLENDAAAERVDDRKSATFRLAPAAD